MFSARPAWLAPALLTLALAPAAFGDEPPRAAGGSAPAVAEGRGVAFEPGTPALADVLAQAAAAKKPVFMDFFTDT